MDLYRERVVRSEGILTGWARAKCPHYSLTTEWIRERREGKLWLKNLIISPKLQ
jgi:hypothetical protein